MNIMQSPNTGVGRKLSITLRDKDLSAVTGSSHAGCLEESSMTDYGYEYSCGYGTTISCDDCKYGGGRKDPAAKCNQE